MKNIARLVKAFLFRDTPVYVHYGITHRCNLRCRMCHIRQDSVPEEEELSLEEIGQAAGLLRRMGAVYLSIGGGEPFLREDLVQVVRSLSDKGFMLRLLTNGVLAQEGLIKELVSAGLREVSVSLDTLDSNKQAYICNAPGTWEKTVRNIELFASLVPAPRLLLINTVVSPLNLSELPALYRFAQSREYYISFIPVDAGRTPEFVFNPGMRQEVDSMYDELINLKRKSRSAIFNSSLFLEKSRIYLKSGACNWKCDAGRLYLSLDPRGNISICHNFQGVPLLENIGKNFMASREFREARDRLTRTCPGCMRPCWAELSFAFRGQRSFREMAEIMRRRKP